ncbi:MAG TPA: gluconate 2-dehydrogenase subunit 3 family protein, partial [Mycobacteriales bacterium]|nr:gluconate 2-dehydrogenase subunit 3 family protein [Mycobacteriales bacterium]
MISETTLRAVVDRLVPADDYPSGWDSGVGDFLERIFATDLIDSRDRLQQGLDQLGDFANLDPADQDRVLGSEDMREFVDWLTLLVMQGFYGDPGNGGNRDEISWRALGFRVLPTGVSRPDPVPELPGTAPIDDEYEVIVIGAGAGGGIAACLLAEAGRRVLLIERGDALGSNLGDHLRNQRSVFGYETPAGPPIAGNPRVLESGEVISPADGRWSNNAMVLGGGTRVYGAQAWRFCPEDFRMASTYGVPEGSSLADWPISYEDLAPYYDRAEWELGVSGDPSGNSAEGPRTRG